MRSFVNVSFDELWQFLAVLRLQEIAHFPTRIIRTLCFVFDAASLDGHCRSELCTFDNLTPQLKHFIYIEYNIIIRSLL